jgi:hypothetical protein
MMLYYFTNKKFGLENLEKRRLKISLFSTVNDPFELLGVELSDKTVRKTVQYESSVLTKEKGLLCFSSDKYNPVQWAHYSDNHKGLCLGFEIPNSYVEKVSYVANRLNKSILNAPEKQKKLLTTKFNHWSYEQEYRMLLELINYPEESPNLRFKHFDELLTLKEVYIGCRSELKFEDIKNAFQSTSGSVVVKHTRPAFKDFKIVWDKKKKSIRI